MDLQSNLGQWSERRIYLQLGRSRLMLLLSILLWSFVTIPTVLAAVPLLSPGSRALAPDSSIASAGGVDLHDTLLRGNSAGRIQHARRDIVTFNPNNIVGLSILVADEDSAIAQQHKTHLLTRASSDSDSFPAAFDTSLSNNFTTATCPNFFNSFLSNSTITSCHAVSMLLRDSSSFFHVLTSATLTSELLDTACASNVTDCASILSALAVELLKEDVCGKDYSAGNPLVTNAYTDMITYEPLYRATCLQSPSTKNYCFVDAISNTTNSADYDVYFLAYGSTISASPSPTCNKCLQATLALFATWAEVDGQPLVNSYIPSAEAINTDCGDNFANVNITVGSERISSGSGLVAPLPQWSTWGLVTFSIGLATLLTL